MIIKVQLVEGFWTTNWKTPIEIDTDKYPELAGMTEQAALNYVCEHAKTLRGDPEDPEDRNVDWSIWDAANEADVEYSREKNYDAEIEPAS